MGMAAGLFGFSVAKSEGLLSKIWMRLATMRRAQDTDFRAPCLMRSTIDAQATKGFSNITCVYAIPTTPGRCRAIVRNVFLFKSPVPRFVFSKFSLCNLLLSLKLPWEIKYLQQRICIGSWTMQ